MSYIYWATRARRWLGSPIILPLHATTYRIVYVMLYDGAVGLIEASCMRSSGWLSTASKLVYPSLC